MKLHQVRDLGLLAMVAVVYGFALYHFYPAPEVIVPGFGVVPAVWVGIFQVLGGEDLLKT
jgi:hypothetical protein